MNEAGLDCVSCGFGPRLNEGLWCDACFRVMQHEATIQGIAMERDEARAAARDFAEQCSLVRERWQEAQEAAETYHAAWQDAAVYWEDLVRHLKQEVVNLAGLAQCDDWELVSKELEGLRNRNPWLPEKL